MPSINVFLFYFVISISDKASESFFEKLVEQSFLPWNYAKITRKSFNKGGLNN